MSPFAKSLACLLLCAPVLPAVAADFTLEVPVHVQNAPSITTVYVDCLVSRVRVGDPTQAGGTNVVGRGGQRVTPTGANYDSVAVVEINASGIIPPSEARSYICAMRAAGSSRNGTTYTASPGNFQDVYETATGQTLDHVIATVKGNLP